MQIKHQILKDENLLILKFVGEWSLEDYKTSLNEVLQNKDFEKVNKVLSDFRELSSETAMRQLKELVNIRTKNIKKKYIHVRIVSGPQSTVTAHLYKEQLNKLGYKEQYCSTLDRALSLLNLEKSAKQIKELLENL